MTRENQIEILTQAITALVLVRQDIARDLISLSALLEKAIDRSKEAEVLCINLKYKQVSREGALKEMKEWSI